MTGFQLSETLRAMSVWASNVDERTADLLATRLSKADWFIQGTKHEGLEAGEAFCGLCRFQEPAHSPHCPLHALAPTPDALEEMEVR